MFAVNKEIMPSSKKLKRNFCRKCGKEYCCYCGNYCTACDIVYCKCLTDVCVYCGAAILSKVETSHKNASNFLFS